MTAFGWMLALTLLTGLGGGFLLGLYAYPIMWPQRDEDHAMRRL